MRTPFGARVDLAPIPMRPETRARLLERYSPSVERLEKLTGENLSAYRL
ncbi:MAG: hypothetical protein H5U40_12870 [Polyangiaceae bacterium]|nr:hypothetical protein [Polyangiaceae bacterium]